MFHNIVNKDNIHKPQTKVEVSNFQNMTSSDIHSTLSNPLRLHTNSHFKPELLIDEVSIEPTKKDNDKHFNVLTFIKENTNLSQEKEEQEKNDNKEGEEKEKMVSTKLDTVTSVFVGSISIIGLFCVYKAIKKTM